MRGIAHHEDWGWSNCPRFGGGSSNVTSTTKTNSDPWTGQQPYLSGSGATPGVFPSAATIYANPSDYPQYYPSSTYAQLTPSQTGLISQIVGQGSTGTTALNAGNTALTDILNQGTSGTQQAFNQGQGYLSSALNPNFVNPWTSPGFGNVVSNTLASTIPATTSSFIGGGRADSGLAQRAATEGATSAVGELSNKFYQSQEALQQQAAAQASSNQLNQQKNLQMAAATAPSIDTQKMSNLNSALTAAGMSQTDAQNVINDAVSRWNYNQQLPMSMLDWYSNLVGGTGYGSQTSSLNTQPYYSNVGANVLSGLSTGAALASMPVTTSGQSLLQYLSDRRLKTDIHKIGESDSGFPLYTFRYKGESAPVLHMGLMAQDVAKTRPEAVTRTPFGLAVDYAKALAA